MPYLGLNKAISEIPRDQLRDGWDANSDGKITFKEFFPKALEDLKSRGLILKDSGKSPVKDRAKIEIQSQITDNEDAFEDSMISAD
jgi:hypothetical protein